MTSVEGYRPTDPSGGAVLMPDGSTMPRARSTSADYDHYFCLVRNNPDLAQWSRTCLAVLTAQRRGLADSQLPKDDRLRILDGANTVLEIALEKWLTAETAAAG